MSFVILILFIIWNFQLNKENILKQLLDAKAKLKEAQTAFASKSARGDDERMELLKLKLPDIQQTINQVLEDQGI